MIKQKRALGKGLSSLLDVAPVESSSNESVKTVVLEKSLEISLGNISPNPFQPRLDFSNEELQELASSIEKQGLLQPIALRKVDDSYQIISGERRFRAFKLLKRETIPVTIIDGVDDTQMLEMALVENIQRANLNQIETALSYQRLLFECGLSHQQLSEQIGKSRSVITNTLRLLKLPDDLQQMVRTGDLSMGHARALLGFGGDEQRQEKIAKQIVSEGLSVRAVEKLANPISKPAPEKAPVPEQYELLTSEWKSRSGLGVQIKPSTSGIGRGKVEISFQNDEELQLISSLFGSVAQ